MLSERIINLENRIESLNKNLKALEPYINNTFDYKSRLNSFLKEINHIEYRVESLMNKLKFN